MLKYHTKKTYGGVKVQLHTFLTFAVDGGELFHALATLPQGKRSWFPWIGD